MRQITCPLTPLENQVELILKETDIKKLYFMKRDIHPDSMFKDIFFQKQTLALAIELRQSQLISERKKLGAGAIR